MKLYHVSEEPDIAEFHPRPSPQVFEGIKDNVVFAISGEMLHNYLLPRDCPRVTFYAKADSTAADIEKFIGSTEKKYIMNVEECRIESINKAELYLYELPAEDFELLDKGAGYYVSYKSVKPSEVIVIDDILEELKRYNTEIRVLHSIRKLAEDIAKSSLQYSIVRLRNAKS